MSSAEYSDLSEDAYASRAPRLRQTLKSRRRDKCRAVKMEYNSDDEAMVLDDDYHGHIQTKSEHLVRAALSRHHVALVGEFQPPRPRHTVVKDVSDIDYTPENALENEMKMLGSLQDFFKLVVFRDELRPKALQSASDKLRAAAATPPKTTIAICGDNILPSSCIGACTSVVTEITYHRDEKIAADIHFLSLKQWKEEVSLCLQDAVARDDDSDADSDADEPMEAPLDAHSPAGIAWQKVHAVYPKLRFADLSWMTAEEVIETNDGVAKLLGTVKRIECDDSEEFKDIIAPYIRSSVQEPLWDSDDSDLDDEVSAEMWPLVAKAVVYCNAEVLSSGATFVDLPGVADSNSARDNIAKEYMKDADHFWILAPINRAVSDRTAHDLLSDAFKTQLQMDGKLHGQSITFIATKSDHLIPSEVIRDLRLQRDPELKRLDEETAIANKLELEVNNLRRLEEDCVAHIAALKRGDTSYVSKYDSNGKKRKLTHNACAGLSNRRKMSKHAGPPGWGHADADVDFGDAGTAPTEASLLQKLEKIRRDISECTARVQANRKKADIEKEKKAVCARRRSEYARKTLKSGFRKIVRDSDRNGQNAEDARRFNIPVFTVSSTDCLKLKGQNAGDGPTECFSDVEETGIPHLQRFCHEITLSTRHKSALAHLSEFSAFTQSVSAFARVAHEISDRDKQRLRLLWETNDDPRVANARAAYDLDNDGVSRRLKREFEDTVRTMVAELRQHCGDSMEDKVRAGENNAADSCVKTLDEVASSMRWNTYRAILVRHGRFREHDLNRTLTRPLREVISPSWSTLFESLPFAEFEDRLLVRFNELLEDFYDSASSGVKEHAKAHGEICRDVVSTLLPQAFVEAKAVLVQEQKVIWRSLDGRIADHLHEAYADAGAEKGRGSVRRQKTIMREYLDKNKNAIFHSCAEVILNGVHQALGTAGEALRKPLEELAGKVEMDLSVLWEIVDKDAPQVRAREYLSTLATEIQGQIHLWMEAAQSMDDAQRRTMDNY